jgi:hypothetical protein
MRRTSRNIMRRETQRRAPARPCEIHFNSHAPGLVTGERLGRGTATGLILAIDEGERPRVGVAHDAAAPASALYRFVRLNKWGEKMSNY